MKDEKTFWRERHFWISALIFVIGLLQMFIQSEVSDRKTEKWLWYAVRGLRMAMKFLEEDSIISIKPPADA